MAGRAAVTLEPGAVPARGPAAGGPNARPRPPPDVFLQLGELVVPVVLRPGEAVSTIEDGIRLGPVDLQYAELVMPPGPEAGQGRGAVAPSEPAVGGSLHGAIDAPFVSGSAVIGLTPSGAPSGEVSLEGSIGLAGVPVAEVRYRSVTWSPAQPLPVPRVTLSGTHLALDLTGFADLAAVEVSGLSLHALGDGRWEAPLPDGILEALGPVGTAPEGVAIPAGATPADPLAAAEAALRVEPSQREPLADPARSVLQTLLGVDLAALGIHVDEPAQRATATTDSPAFTLGAEIFFGEERFGFERREQAAILARAVRLAAAGLREVVALDAPMADPAQAESGPVPAVAPAAGPQVPGPEAAATEAVATEAAAEALAEVPAEGNVEREPAAPEIAAGAAGGAPEEPPEGVAAETPPAAPVELIMPPAPTEPGPAQVERMGAVGKGARSAARRAAALPSADETTEAARGGVTEPPAETAARAEAAVAQALGGRADPSPKIVALCDRIQTSIRERRPVDEDELDRTNPEKVAADAGNALNQGIEGDAARVEGSYEPINNPPAGSAQLTPTPLEAPPATVAPPSVQAEGAAPDPVPEENLSLDADRDALDARVEESRINRPSSEPIQEPPFSTVREGQAEMATLAETGPSQVAAKQKEAVDRAQQEMAVLQLKAVEALNASRTRTVGGVAAGQTGMVGSEEQTREQISREAQAIFADAQTQVNAILAPLTQRAMTRWTTGVDQLSTEFKDSLARVKAWIDERHSGVGGFFVGGWDALTGLPDWITDEYGRAERQFGDGVCNLLLDVSADVNTVIALAEGVIDSARQRIDALFTNLPAGLREWAAQEKEKFNRQLDGLHEQAQQTRTGFVQDISKRATTAVSEVQAEIEKLREEAKGLIGKVADAIQAFIDDPVKAIIEGLLRLVGIPPASFWAVVAKVQQVISDIADDPMNFVNNLVDAVRQGFQQFFDNFGTHVLKGFWDWLFSGLGPVGVQLPPDTSVRSLITLALQIMGITWPNIRKILVRYIGEENVALIEQAWQLISTLIEKGPSGILDMIKEKLNPATLLETIIKAAIDYLIEALIKQIVVRVIGLLNPVGAIVQAIELIYKVLKWIFQNAAKIFRLIETVVNGLADIIAGNLTAMAGAVEKALAGLIPIVIDFLAGWLGLGDLPIKIAEIIKSLQERVLAVIDQIVGWLVEQAKALLQALGLGGDEDEEDGDGAEDTELGETVKFQAAGESHKLWIELVSVDATVMVSSFAEDVGTKLQAWQGELDERFPKGSAQRPEAEGLLTTAKTQLTELDAKSKELAPDYAEAQAGGGAPAAEGETKPALQSDAPVEADEHTLSDTLNRLFELFGGEGKEELLKKIADALPIHADKQAEEIHANWWKRASTIKIGNDEKDPLLWEPSVFDGTETAALGLATEPPTHEPLLPWFTTAKGERDAGAALFKEYALVSAATGHSVRQNFREKLGQAALVQLKSAGLQAVDAAKHVEDEYKAGLRERINNIEYFWDSAGGGRFSLPTERIPDHKRYKPEDIVSVEKDGIRTTTYRTITGQQFIVTEPVGDGLTFTVEGLGLRRMSGRGVTQDSPWFTSGQGFNRAHIVANEFGGTGFAIGNNLVTTSDHYNQVEMRAIELDIGRSIVQFARWEKIEPGEVEFNLMVTVQLGRLTDPTLLAKIKQQPWFKKEAGTDLDADIVGKINAKQVHPDLLRVTGCQYTWESVKPPGLSAGARLGPDLWLLAK